MWRYIIDKKGSSFGNGSILCSLPVLLKAICSSLLFKRYKARGYRSNEICASNNDVKGDPKREAINTLNRDFQLD